MPHENVYGICDNKCLVKVEPKENTDAVEARVTTLEDEMNNVENCATSLEERTTTLESDMDAVEERTTSLESRATTIENELDDDYVKKGSIPVPITAKLTTTKSTNINSDAYVVKDNTIKFPQGFAVTNWNDTTDVTMNLVGYKSGNESAYITSVLVTNQMTGATRTITGSWKTQARYTNSYNLTGIKLCETLSITQAVSSTAMDSYNFVRTAYYLTTN